MSGFRPDLGRPPTSLNDFEISWFQYVDHSSVSRHFTVPRKRRDRSRDGIAVGTGLDEPRTPHRNSQTPSLQRRSPKWSVHVDSGSGSDSQAPRDLCACVASPSRRRIATHRCVRTQLGSGTLAGAGPAADKVVALNTAGAAPNTASAAQVRRLAAGRGGRVHSPGVAATDCMPDATVPRCTRASWSPPTTSLRPERSHVAARPSVDESCAASIGSAMPSPSAVARSAPVWYRVDRAGMSRCGRNQPRDRQTTIRARTQLANRDSTL